MQGQLQSVQKCKTILQFSLITENEAGILTVEHETVFHDLQNEVVLIPSYRQDRLL